MDGFSYQRYFIHSCLKNQACPTKSTRSALSECLPFHPILSWGSYALALRTMPIPPKIPLLSGFSIACQQTLWPYTWQDMMRVCHLHQSV